LEEEDEVQQRREKDVVGGLENQWYRTYGLQAHVRMQRKTS